MSARLTHGAAAPLAAISIITATVVALISAPASAQVRHPASAVAKTRPSAAAEITALHGAMPRSFDFYPDDPCSGVWDIRAASGELAMQVTIYRYRGLPVMHLSGPGFGQSNSAVIRLDPHSIRIPSSDSAGIVLRCAGMRAVAELSSGGRPVVLNVTPGVPDAAPASAAAPPPRTIAPTQARAPVSGSVRERNGNIFYVDGGGVVHQLTQSGNDSDPVLSPDGSMIAYVQLDGKATEEAGSSFTSLWVADTATGTKRRLFASKPNDEPKLDMRSFEHPRFSLDGGYIYVAADAWTTSSAVHQVSVATGQEHYVVDGWLNGIIRTGPYRGYLIVGQHRYREPAGTGSYNPVSVIRPDGKTILLIPGSDGDDDEHDYAIDWLRKNGWTAS